MLSFTWLRISDSVVGPFGIKRTLAELKLIEMFFPAVESLEDRPMQVLECLVAADFNHAADLLVRELLADGPTRKEHGDDVQVRRSRRRAAWSLGRTHRTLRGLAIVPLRNLIFRDQYFQ